MRATTLRTCLLLAALLGGQAAHAQTPTDASASPARAATPAPAPAPKAMPADVTTHHTLVLPDGEQPGRTLHFSATAGAIRLTDDKAAPRADIAFIAYQLDGADPRTRKVTFVLNGGPGFASGWLQVGAVGPWRIPFGGDATAPSASPEPLPNAETWLDFTDLVFIDPADTGYSRILTTNDEARKRIFSVDGDIQYLAETIRMWLDRYNRDTSPKYLLGESYGGFRAPRLARELASAQGVGLSGLVLLSPALDIGGRSWAFDPFYFAIRLPSMTAAARAAHGPVTRAQLADAEQYAATDFLVDATKGESDPAAIARRSARVAELTGIDPAVVQRYHGLLINEVFLHELDRAAGRVGSNYDATITIADPWPLWTSSDYPDPGTARTEGAGHQRDGGDLPDAIELASRCDLSAGKPDGVPPMGLGPRHDEPAAVDGPAARSAGARPASACADRARSVRPDNALFPDPVADQPTPRTRAERTGSFGDLPGRPHVLHSGPLPCPVPRGGAQVVGRGVAPLLKALRQAVASAVSLQMLLVARPKSRTSPARARAQPPPVHRAARAHPRRPC